MAKKKEIEINFDSQKLNNRKIIEAFPKIELHRHLEGAMHVKTLYDISLKNNLSYPKSFDEFQNEVQFPKDSEPDFLVFLSKFKNNWYKSYEDIEKVCYESVKQLARESIFYIELRFSPEHYALENNFDRIEVTKLVIDACNKAAKEENINVKYLITFNRAKQDQKEMIKLYKKLAKANIPDIVGIDLAGDEIHYPPKDFAKLFTEIYNDGLYKVTVHAGEVTPASQIWDAIMFLYASRIGHGVAAIHDQKLQMYLKEKNIALEQCITSNHHTGAWPDEKTHPCAKLIEAGVPVTINTDDPMIQNSDLTDDYLKLIKYFSFDLNKLISINKTAIFSAFIDDKEKVKLWDKYMEKIKEFEKKFSSNSL
ncbi:MAG TPA: adenosine deaminase [Exilispira sp.]|nr:adenosine deaminase [Exilispira sp.]HPO60345.1 adenosine deaminase [Exilispira sp.]